MFLIFAVIIGGIVTGRLLIGWRLAFVQRLITVIIWALLFLLGVEVGADRALVGGLATLGGAAFTIFGFSVAGSMLAAWLLWRRIGGRATAADADGRAAAQVAANERGRAAGGTVVDARTAGAILAAAEGDCGAGRDAGVFRAEADPDFGGDGGLSVTAADIGTGGAIRSRAEAGVDGAIRSGAEAGSAGWTTDDGVCAPETPVSTWTALKGSLVIVAFFAAGCAAGLFTPLDAAGSRVTTCVLYALMFCVGVTLGNDRTLAGRIRRLDPRLALLPVATALGTLAGAALAAPLLGGWSLADSLAVGAGFGYYSLSSIFIADLRGPELATIALLCNVMREIFTLLAAPLAARWCGPLAAVSIGGATSFDTTLPIITQAAGRPYAVVSIFHGCALDFSVPFLVTLFCTI